MSAGRVGLLLYDAHVRHGGGLRHAGLAHLAASWAIAGEAVDRGQGQGLEAVPG